MRIPKKNIVKPWNEWMDDLYPFMSLGMLKRKLAANLFGWIFSFKEQKLFLLRQTFQIYNYLLARVGKKYDYIGIFAKDNLVLSS